MRLNKNSCVSDVLRLHSLGKLLPEQKDLAKTILEKKIDKLEHERRNAKTKEEKTYYVEYMDSLQFKIDRITTTEPRYQY